MDQVYNRSNLLSVVIVGSLFLAFLFLALSIINEGDPYQPPISMDLQQIPAHYPGLAGKHPRTMNANKGQECIRGQVCDAAGTPLSNIAILIDQRGGDPAGMLQPRDMAPRWTTRTDVQGFFSVEILPVGAFLVMALRNDAHALCEARLTEGGPAAECFLRLRHSVTVAGRVRDKAGRALLNARIYPIACDRLSTKEAKRYGWMPAQSDEYGRFALPHLPYGRWKVLVRGAKQEKGLSDYLDPLPVEAAFRVREAMLNPHAGRVFKGPDLREILAELPDLPLVFSEATYSAQGQVIHAETGRPQAQIKILATEQDFGVETVKARSQAAGHFSLAGLRAGEYALRVVPERFAPVDAPVMIRVGPEESPDDLLLRVDRGARIRGRVLSQDEGAGLAAVEVALEGGPKGRVDQTDLGGYYQFTALSEGDYSLWIPPQGDLFPSGAFAAEVSVPRAQLCQGPVFRADTGATLRGYVSSDQSDQIRGANVFLTFEAARKPVRAIRAAQDGSFAFYGLEEGVQVWIWAEYLGRSSTLFGPLNVTGSVLPEAPLVISLPCRGSIQGAVRNAQDDPMPFVRVWCESSAPDELQRKQCTTDNRGAFYFDRLTPATYHLSLEESDAPALDVEVGENEALRDLLLRN